MTPHVPTLIAVSAAALLAAWPVQTLAQAPDFGDDSNQWAKDGECDDPRFAGPGMAAVTVDLGIRTDAADCAAAFAAGRVTLIDGGQGAAPAAPVKGAQGAATPPPAPDPTAGPDAGPDAGSGDVPATTASPGGAGPNFGDDSSEWANDGECDDRRFVGQGMAASLGWTHAGRDATDCRALHEAGRIRVWDWTQALAATQCASIDFGDDAGEFARDGECDDIRFEGLAMAGGVSDAHTGHDAADCRQLCAIGTIALRDY